MIVDHDSLKEKEIDIISSSSDVISNSEVSKTHVHTVYCLAISVIVRCCSNGEVDVFWNTIFFRFYFFIFIYLEENFTK